MENHSDLREERIDLATALRKTKSSDVRAQILATDATTDGATDEDDKSGEDEGLDRGG